MSVPRRVVLQGLGSAAVGLAVTPAAVPAATHRLFGYRHVIPVVREQIAIMQELRSSRHGVDGQELCRVQAQYSVLCGGLYWHAGVRRRDRRG